jgi:lipopolysaccharide export system protein LptC
MKLASTRLFPLVLMLALALLSFWLERAARQDPAQPGPLRHDPDYSAEQFTIVDYGRAGAPESTLRAARMVHFPDDDATELVAPRLVQTRPGQPRLELSAERGLLSEDGTQVFLHDNVVLLRPASTELAEARIESSFMHVLRERSLVRTDREVRISERGRSLVGRGMEYDNEARTLALQAEVRGSFGVEGEW